MRKLVSILLVLVLSTLLLVPAQAATTRLLYQNYDVQGTTLSCYGVPLPVGGDLSVSVGSNKMADAYLSTIQDAEVPVTVYFLVDTASTLSNDTIKQQTDILSVISSHMGKNDTMVISTIDETFVEGPLLTEKDARTTAIETLGRKDSWATNLYMGLDKAVDSLSTSTAFQTNRFLVILSDGHDDLQEKVNLDNLTAKIAANNIPIFNLVLGNGTNYTQDITQLTKFDEASLGGFLCQLKKEKVSAAEAAEKVWSAIQSNTVIRFNASTLDTSVDSELLIRYDYKDNRYEDTLLLRAVDLQKRLIIPALPSGDASDAEPVVEPENNVLKNVLIIGGAVFLLLVIGVVAFLLLKPKKTTPALDFSDFGSDSGSSDYTDTNPVTGYSEPDSGFGGGTRPQSYGSTTPVDGSIQVSMVALMHSEITCNFTLGESAENTLGRDNRASIVLNGSDRKLSGVHAGILWDGTHLLIRDKNSTNGTFVNGAPCADDAWYLVENGATIKAGSYDYRVTYQA